MGKIVEGHPSSGEDGAAKKKAREKKEKAVGA